MSGAPKVNPHIAHARSQASFNPLKLTYFLHDGPEKTRRKRYIQRLAGEDIKREGLKKYSEQSREELYEQSLKKLIFLRKRCRELNISDNHEQEIFKNMLLPNEPNPLAGHDYMFMPAINTLGTKEQKEKWLPLAETCEILGAYTQTELGHGTFLRGLETVATYDPTTKEFIIDSPTVTSAKFWPGGLGKTANYALTMSKLVVDGHNCGMQSFLVPLRDLNTHKPLPGITIGDIGAKYGCNRIDNGFLRMNKVRIPRENMLMRYAQVTEDGRFIQPKNNHLIYGTMTLIRSKISLAAAIVLSQAVTIATRYSTVRFQSEINPGKGEVPILAFQTQQHKLLVQLATAYALFFSGKRTMGLWNKVNSQIESGILDGIPELHTISSGLKALSTEVMAHGVEQCRMACGGHGYLMASGIPKIYMNEVALCTAEGVNTVLFLQTARSINKIFEAGKRGDNLPSGVKFLMQRDVRSRLTEKLELDDLKLAFEYRAAVLIQEANKRMHDLLERGVQPAEAWNNSSQAFTEAAIAFSQACVARDFISTVQVGALEPSIVRVLTQLCQLFCAHEITSYSGHFRKGDFMTDDQLDMVQAKVYDLLADLRPNAVALVDAFDYPDEVLDSDIGRYDGNVYDALMKSAKNSKLNQNEIHEGIFKYVKPYVEYLKQQKEVKARL